MGLYEQRREAGCLKLRGGDSEGIERQDLMAAVRLELFVIGDNAGYMNNRRVESTIASLAWAELVTDGLLNLYRHTPCVNQFRTHFSEVASDIGLLHLGE